MRMTICFVSVVALTLIVGCQGVVGTWTESSPPQSDSPIGQVSFCPDGTFTAGTSAGYGGGKTHVMSGRYEVEGDKIELKTEGQTRWYGITVSEDELVMTYKGKEAKLVRMKHEM